MVNLQGDEPLIEPEAIEALVSAMADPAVEMATLARPLEDGELMRPHVVKVVCSASGDALYFSRAAIPHRRAGGPSPLARAHVGIYAYREPFLQAYAALEPGRLEEEESLEQLRALERGHRIRVVDTTYRGFGVDTPEDLERARAVLEHAERAQGATGVRAPHSGGGAAPLVAGRLSEGGAAAREGAWDPPRRGGTPRRTGVGKGQPW